MLCCAFVAVHYNGPDGAVLPRAVPLVLRGMEWQCPLVPTSPASLRDDQHAGVVRKLLSEGVHEDEWYQGGQEPVNIVFQDPDRVASVMNCYFFESHMVPQRCDTVSQR